MAVFSRYSQVLEADGKPMPVRHALAEINRVLDETLAESEGDMDSDTRFCVAWYEQYGTAERPYGEAEVLFTAKNTSFAGLEQAGVLVGGGGRVRLKQREELDPVWDPTIDDRIVDWECVQHLVRAMTSETGGGVGEAARLASEMGSARAANARALAYRLYTLSERKGWTAEALAYNILVTSWPQIQAEIARQGQRPGAVTVRSLMGASNGYLTTSASPKGLQVLTGVLAPYVAGELRARFSNEWWDKGVYQILHEPQRRGSPSEWRRLRC